LSCPSISAATELRRASQSLGETFGIFCECKFLPNSLPVYWMRIPPTSSFFFLLFFFFFEPLRFYFNLSAINLTSS
jgi:hypothetical protein